MALAPLALAQVPTQVPATVSIKIESFGPPAEPGTIVPVKVHVNYQHFVAGSLALAPTSVHLKVTEAPRWVVTLVSPSTLLFPIRSGLTGGGNVDEGSESATVFVYVRANAPAGAIANVRILAIADANQPIAAAATEEQLVAKSGSSVCAPKAAIGSASTRESSVKDAASAEERSSASDTARAPPTSASGSQEPEIHSVSSRAVPTLVAYAPALLGLAGLAVGLSLAIARRKR